MAVTSLRATRARPRAGARPRPRRENRAAFVMLAPLLALLGVFVVWPLLHAVYISFFTWSFYDPAVFVGLRNYLNVLTDVEFVNSVTRGLLFSAIVVPAQVTIAFVFANLVKSVSRADGDRDEGDDLRARGDLRGDRGHRLHAHLHPPRRAAQLVPRLLRHRGDPLARRHRHRAAEPSRSRRSGSAWAWPP
ncbi:carbohydrate ABC transporter permease [Nonomuraea ferruginea]